MNSQERKALVLRSKSKGQNIQGEYIDLHPCTLEHGQEIVRLRNQKKSRYYLNQKHPSTIEGQNKWYDSYVQRDDDIYWCIYNKLGIIIGSIRLYDIETDGNICKEGSFIIDEAYAMSGPYALEAKILVFNFAFDTLKINKVINENRADNKNMNSIDKRIGFNFVKEFERDGAEFYLHELTKDTYKRADLIYILDRWRGRE